MRFGIAIAATATLLTACSSSPSAPDGALRGRFGGNIAEINATADVVDVRYRCDTFRAPGPIIPDATGRFFLLLTPRPGNRSSFATLTATSDGRTIRFDARTVYLDFERRDSGYVVRRGEAPDYTLLSCRAPTP